ncbi:MAG: hypothetical protein JWQ38_1420 [Flavipsychrobacter sp.]|nr:hypothetical protein [Flavipsychrobacter sp.]
MWVKKHEFMSRSLRKDVSELCKQKLPKVFESNFQRKLINLASLFNHKHRGLFVIPVVLVFYLLGQFIKPSFLQILHIDASTAFLLIDQRASNMATIFSVTLVVIGWLITNLSIKESLSYQLMFKRIYLYPIFYFIATLIASLVCISLFRNTTIFSAPDAIVSASYLIVGAICAITFLFRRLIQVIDDNYFFDSLEKEVLREVYALNYNAVYVAYGKKLYDEHISSIGISAGSTSFFSKENNHFRISIVPADSKTNDETSIDDILNEEPIIVKDVNTEKIAKLLSSSQLKNQNYYKSVGIFEKIIGSFPVFEIHKDNTLTARKIKRIQSCYKTKSYQPRQEAEENIYTEYLQSRIVQEVKNGKKKNVEAMLRTMRKVYEMDDIIKSNL